MNRCDAYLLAKREVERDFSDICSEFQVPMAELNLKIEEVARHFIESFGVGVYAFLNEDLLCEVTYDPGDMSEFDVEFFERSVYSCIDSCGYPWIYGVIFRSV